MAPTPPVPLERTGEVDLPLVGHPQELIPTVDGCAVVSDEGEIYQAYPDGSGAWLTSRPESVSLAETEAMAPTQNEYNNWVYELEGTVSEPPFMCQSNAIYGLAPVSTGDIAVRQAITNFMGSYQEQQIVATLFGDTESPANWECLWLDHLDSQIALPVAAWGEAAFCLAAKSFSEGELSRVIFYE
jgi:hypothetical protein